MFTVTIIGKDGVLDRDEFSSEEDALEYMSDPDIQVIYPGATKLSLEKIETIKEITI